jgi:excisionase family DNA binding protein
MTSVMERQEPLLTIQEVASILRLHPVSVRRLVARGDLPSVRLGTGARARVRVDAADLRAFTTPMRPRHRPRDWNQTRLEAATRS